MAFVQGRLQLRPRLGQIVGRGLAGDQLIDRRAQGAVPVLIETVAELFSDRSDTQQVDVGEVELGLRVEVLVTQVAPADDGGAAVRQPQLVVHATVLLREIEQPAHGAGDTGTATQLQRIEQANLNLWVSGQCGNGLDLAIAGEVVKQDAHPHATVSGLEQFADQQSGADAVLHDVVLQVEAALRVADQLGTGGKGLAAVR